MVSYDWSLTYHLFIFIRKVFNCLHKLSMTFKYNYPLARVLLVEIQNENKRAVNHVTSLFLNYLRMASEGRNTLFTLMQRL